jgi:formate dehydrogenase subunit delta
LQIDKNKGSMNTEHLVTMANQIGDFFQSYPDQELAKKEIVTHLKRFWASSMREQLMEHTTPSFSSLRPK